jgi:hypothetical protein
MPIGFIRAENSVLSSKTMTAIDDGGGEGGFAGRDVARKKAVHQAGKPTDGDGSIWRATALDFLA